MPIVPGDDVLAAIVAIELMFVGFAGAFVLTSVIWLVFYIIRLLGKVLAGTREQPNS